MTANTLYCVSKPEGLAKHNQTLSSWMGSGDESRKRIDLELFHVRVWNYIKLCSPSFQHAVIESSMIILLSPTELEFVTLLKACYNNINMCGLATIHKLCRHTYIYTL